MTREHWRMRAFESFARGAPGTYRWATAARTVGPAATQISEIARRAGVQRVTVYNHFPDEASLFAACSAHWRGLHPAPDPAEWTTIEDSGERLRLALYALYAWYRETEPMTSNILRDAQTIPALGAAVESSIGRYMAHIREILAQPFSARGRRRERLDASVRAATDFNFWQALASLGDRDAAELAATFVEIAGTR